MEIGIENDIPLISLVQSAGVFLPQQFRVFHKGGQLFRDLALRSQQGKPSCAIVFGSSTAGGAYHPALSDYTIFVENQAQVFLGGPPLVKMATGETIGAEELGGASIHGMVTGLADQVALDEFDAIQKAREWVSMLRPDPPRALDINVSVPPRYPADEMLSLVNPDIRKPFNMREEICPIIFFHNVTGFMVGPKAEHAGIIKAGAQFVSAVSCSKVPHISIIIGASYGAGNYAMCGRSYRPRFLFTWPSGRCSVMGPDQLAGVMETIKSNAQKNKAQATDEQKASTTRLRDEAYRDAECYSTSAMLIDDGIIDPRDTRDVLGMCLEVVKLPRVEDTSNHRLLAPTGASKLFCNLRSADSVLNCRETWLRMLWPLFVADLPSGGIINKVLIANRGEIACRIIETCRKLGLKSVAAYVTEDSLSRHITDADEAIQLGSIEQSTKNPFLDIDLLVQRAIDSGAQAIHPGYGYLSENPEFADRVREAGLVFIGPTSAAMSTLGDKRSAKEYLREHAPDVPLIPGFSGSSQDVADLKMAAEEIGYPVILKASAGGGGKGMRIVREPAHLQAELDRAQSEAKRSFGSSDCILEKFIESSKHIEIQIIGDQYGEIVPLFERDCSVQRRNQKVIEESPCAFLDIATRQRMAQTAVHIAQLIGYEGAGTVEFVLDVTTMEYYFLEVNTRLQVEHPITEEVTGLDIVSLQLYVAAGGKLSSLSIMSNLVQTGHAIECRLCAEDPNRDFFPVHGKISLWHPASQGRSTRSVVRHETAIQTGGTVSIYFDSMISKIVVWAPTRALAIASMLKELANTACIGIKTNQYFLQSCLQHPAFHDPGYKTSFIATYLEELLGISSQGNVPSHLSIIPSLYLQNLSSSQSSNTAFRGVRQRFHNQSYDPFHLQTEVISLGSTSKSNNRTDEFSTSFLCVRQPDSRKGDPGTIEEDIHLHRFFTEKSPNTNSSSIQDSVSPAKELTHEYNTISQLLRNSQHWTNSKPYRAKITRWTTIPTENVPVAPQQSPPTHMEVSINGQKTSAYVILRSASRFDGTASILCHIPLLGEWVEYHRHTLLSYFNNRRKIAASIGEQTETSVKAPMPCKILSILKSVGSDVKAGESVMVVESMKMEMNISVRANGKFHTPWKIGDAVNEGVVLCRVE
ncbi:carbamoyl-phosphate synthase L chain, ATP binding domain-containing protein [Xylogone sp. PMI_703]|nr:carbamoyl-phosphate synthase L chain, ATP binding domain-containing protein [Xylogone sp. PMI_703]